MPSIPGYGYSDAPKQKGKNCASDLLHRIFELILIYHHLGFDASAAARVFTKLMKRLGHEKFIVHGGDWGYLVSKMLSVVFPEK